jgi:trans-2,3-dihydro-3-hydroxyanthranilate isomerase
MVVRVFTRGETGGNHLGVVNDITGLDDDTMQQIAAELGFSETVFVDWQPDEPPFVRIFTPADELPFAGHPLVGTAWVMMVLSPGQMQTLRYRMGEAAISGSGDITWIEIPMTGWVDDPADAAEFLQQAGIGDFEDVVRVMMPLEYVVARLPSAEAVAAVSPRMSVLGERFGTYVYARDGDRVRARFFAPGTAVPEDPATGSAAAALAVLLAHNGELEGRLTIYQGEEIGHSSQIELLWGNGAVSIGGTVVRDEMRMLDV